MGPAQMIQIFLKISQIINKKEVARKVLSRVFWEYIKDQTKKIRTGIL
jgi:hypothetical protein